jgi:hypothetical protein
MREGAGVEVADAVSFQVVMEYGNAVWLFGGKGSEKWAQSRFQWNAPTQVVFGTSHGLRGRCLSFAQSR